MFQLKYFYNKKNISKKILLIKKFIYSNFKGNKNDKSHIIFILGCQRSGTSLLTEIFQKDLNTKVFGEFSQLSNKDTSRIRLNPLNEVGNLFKKCPARILVVKPIVESQNALKLLNYFNNASIIWIYRNYKDVALSNINKFGSNNGYNDLRPIYYNDKKNWRSENLAKNIREVIIKYFSEKIKPYDAAALFWYVRNNFFIDLNLKSHNRVLLTKYEDLVTGPAHVLRKIYNFNKIDYPGDKIVSDVHSNSINKGKNIQLSFEIEEICNNLLKKLDNIYTFNI